MPVYHSVVIEADGKDNGSEKAKTLYITPKIKPKNDRRGRFGTFAKVLLGCVFILALLFLLASIAQYLYDNFGPKPDKSLETYDNVSHPEKDTRSDFARFITNGFTIKVVAVVLLAILGKYPTPESQHEIKLDVEKPCPQKPFQPSQLPGAIIQADVG